MLALSVVPRSSLSRYSTAALSMSSSLAASSGPWRRSSLLVAKTEARISCAMDGALM